MMSITLPRANGMTIVIALEINSKPIPPVDDWNKCMIKFYVIKSINYQWPARRYFSGFARLRSLFTSSVLSFGLLAAASDTAVLPALRPAEVNTNRARQFVFLESFLNLGNRLFERRKLVLNWITCREHVGVKSLNINDICKFVIRTVT